MLIKKSLFLFYLFVFSISANDKLIDVSFENLDLKEFIKISSKVLEKNILINSNVNGKIDFLSQQPIKKSMLLTVLKKALQNNNLQLIKNGDIYIIDKKTDKPNHNKKQNKTTASKNIIEVIALKNIEAKNLQEILISFIKQNKMKFFSSLDVSSNSIILSGKKTDLNILKELVTKLDKDETQIYLKAKIIELNTSLVKDVGLKYGLYSKRLSGNSLYSLSSSLNGTSSMLSELKTVALKIPTLSSSLALGATLNLLHQNYALDILSEPTILCINNRTSSIYVGESISLQNASTVSSGGNTSYSYERKDVGLKLEVKPRVTDNKKVRIEISTILEGVKNSNTNNQPDTMKKEIKTSVIVSNGESVILGGLIEKRNEKTKDEVPGLSSLPFLGNLFTNNNSRNNQKSLAVIITPYIIPSTKNLTFVREELAKLEKLEIKFLEKTLKKIKKKEEKIEALNYQELHKKRVKEIFGT